MSERELGAKDLHGVEIRVYSQLQVYISFGLGVNEGVS